MKRRGVFLVAVSLLLALVIGSNIASGQRVAEDRGESEQFDACSSRQKKISALLLIDESLSLRDNDPDKLRVPALKAALIALNSLTRGQSISAFDVQVSVAGFGRGFHLHKDWSALSDDTLIDFINEIDNQDSRNRDNLTQYDVALEESITQFEKIDQDGESCRLLIWFSDGQHESSTTSGGFSSAEIREITDEICGPDGIADQLRVAGIHLEARGFNKDNPKRLALMGLIAEQVGEPVEFPNGTKLASCGERQPIGRFDVASDPADFFDLFVGLPGTPNEEATVSECADGTPDCAELSFDADESVVNFSVRVTRPAVGINSATIEFNGDNPTSLFDANPPTGAPFTFQKLTDDKVLIDASSADGPIAGSWTLRFEGPSADQVTSLVRFVGQASVSLEDEDGSQLEMLDRYGAQTTFINVDAGLSTSVVERVEVALTSSIGTQSVGAEFDGARYEIDRADIERSLQSPEFEKSSAVEVSVKPIGFVSGLRNSTGSPVPIDYQQSIFQLSVSNGDSFPQWISPVDGSQIPKVEGQSSITLELSFRGPDSGTGYVEFLGIADGVQEHPFEFSGTSQRCKVPAQDPKICPVTIKPLESGYGQKIVPITANLISVDGDSQEILLEARVVLTRDPSVSKGIAVALEWLGLFLLVQVLIRLGFAFLLARFSALESTARRVRIPVIVDVDGAVNAPSGRFIADVSDGAFAFEVTEPQRSFSMFGYDFTSSVWKTFRGSTTTPLGRVSQYGTFIFGSRGAEKPRKKLSEQGTQGLIDLSLRSQWVLAIANSEMARLANEGGYIDGEIVAFLDPFESSELSGQLSDLEFAVAGSSIASDVRDVLEQLKVADLSENNDLAAATTPDDPFDISPSSVDPFSTEPFSEQADNPVNGGRKRFRKKDKGQVSETPPASPDPFDPFV